MPGEQNSRMRSMTRLIVGGAAYVYDMLATRVDQWESSQSASGAEAHTLLAPGSKEAVPEVVSGEAEGISPRTTLIGLVFEAEDRLQDAAQTLDRVTRLAGNVAGWFIEPAYQSRLFKPVRTRFESLVERGAAEVERWNETGRIEGVRSRALVQSVVEERVEVAITYLAADETVQELVQSQGTGLANEVVEETRERTVSADSFLEALVRSVLRMPSRQELPEPPSEVQAQAVHSRQTPAKVSK